MTLHPDKINPIILAMFVWQGFMEAEPWGDEAADQHGGQIGAACNLAPYVEILADSINAFLATDPDTDFPGVLDYEVTERFGAWLRLNPTASTRGARAEADKLVESFFAARNSCAIGVSS